MGHYDNCRPENCGICGQLKGYCEHTFGLTEKDMEAVAPESLARPPKKGINPDRALPGHTPKPGELRWVDAPLTIRGIRSITLERYEYSHTDDKMDWYTVDVVVES